MPMPYCDFDYEDFEALRLKVDDLTDKLYQARRTLGGTQAALNRARQRCAELEARVAELEGGA